MALKDLIQNQTIIIDNHNWGTGKINDWDDDTQDIHFDKETHYPIGGKKQKVKIKVPLNSKRPVTFSNTIGKGIDVIPQKLKNEIKGAFSDERKRQFFIKDLIKTLENYPSIMSNSGKARDAILKLSEHFDLNLTGRDIKTYIGDYLESISQNFTDEESKKRYFIEFNRKNIIAGELNKKTNHHNRMKKGNKQ